MSWRCSALTNAALVSNMVAAKLLSTPRVVASFAATDRAFFIPGADARAAYADAPQRIGFGATISAPHMHVRARSGGRPRALAQRRALTPSTQAICAEALAPALVAGARVLDVGSGSGFLTAVFARLVGPAGSVVAIDHVAELVARSRAALDAALPAELAAACAVAVGDGRGARVEGEFDAIHVGAAMARLDADLVARLKPGGRLVSPVGPAHHLGEGQELILVVARGGGEPPAVSAICSVAYVPLTSLAAQVGDAAAAEAAERVDAARAGD